MTPLQLTEPWILLCTIFGITSVVLSSGLQIPRSLAPAVPWWQNIQRFPIPVQAKQIPKPVTEISCISSDPNIYKIIEESRDRCKGTDYIVTFYQQKDKRYTKLGSFTVNKYLFHNVLMKYSNWILTGDNIDGKGERKANVDVDKRNNNQKDINNVFKPITIPFRTQKVDTKLPRLDWQKEDSYNDKDPQETKHTYDSTNQGSVEPNIYIELNDNDDMETVFKEQNAHRYIEPSYNSKLKGYEVFIPTDSGQQVPSQIINVNIDNVDANNNSLVSDEAIINKIESNPVLIRNLDENTIEVDQVEDIKENIDDAIYIGNLKTEVIDLMINNNTYEFHFEPNKYIDNGIAKKTDNIESDLINTWSTGDTAEYEKDVDSYIEDIEPSVSDADIYYTTYDNNLVYDDEVYQHDFLPRSNVENNFYSDSEFNIVSPSEITYNIDKTDDDNVNLPNLLKTSISPSDSTYNKPSIEVNYDKIEYNEDLSTAAKYTEHTIPLLPLKSDALINVEPSQAPPNSQKLVVPVSQISLSMAEPGLVKSTPNFPLPIKSIIPIIYNSPLTFPGVTAQPLYLEPSKSTPLTSSLSIPKADTYSSQTAATSPINVNYPTSLPLGKLQSPVVNPKYDLTSFNNNINLDNYHIATSETSPSTPTTQCNIPLSTFINPNIDADNLPLHLSANSQPQALDSAKYNYLSQVNIVPKLNINIENQGVPIKTKEFKSLPLYLQDTPQLPVANFLSAINMPRKSIPAYAAPAIDVPNAPIPSITKPITSPLQKATEIQVQPMPTPIYEGKFTNIYIQPLSNPISGITPSFSKEPVMNYPLLVNAAEPTSLNTSHYNVTESPLFTISVPSYSDKPLSYVQPLDINHTPFPVNTPEDTTSPISISSQLDVSSLPDVSYNNSPSVPPIQTTPFSEFSSILSSISPQLPSLYKAPSTTTMHQLQVPSFSLPQVKDVNILPLSPIPPMELSLNYLEVPPLLGTNPHQEMSAPLSESPKTLHVTPLLSISSQLSPLSDSLNSLQPNTIPVFNQVISQPQLPPPNYKPAPISSYLWPYTNLYKLANPLKPKPFHASPASPTILDINESNSPMSSTLTPLPRQPYSVLPYISPLYTKNIFQPIPTSSLPISSSKFCAASYLPESPSIPDSTSYLPISPTLPYAAFNTRISVTPSASPLTNKLKQPSSYLSNSLPTYSYQPDPSSSYANPCQIKTSSASIASPTAAYTLPLLKSPYAELTFPISYLDPLFSFTSALVKKDVSEPLPNSSPVYIKEISHATPLPLMSEIASPAPSMPLSSTVTPVSSSTDSKPVSSYTLLDSIGSQYLPISDITSSTIAYTSSIDNTIKRPTSVISPQSNKEILQPILQLTKPVLPTLSSPYYQTVSDNNLSNMKPLSISSDTNNLLQWNNIHYNVLTTPNKVLQYNSVPGSVSPLSIAQVQPEKLLPSPYQNTLTSPILTSHSASQLPLLPQDLQLSSLLQVSDKPISSKIVNPFEKLSSLIVLSPENTTVLLKPMSNWPIISNAYPKLYPSKNIMPSLYSDFQPQTKFNWITRLNPAYDIAKPMKYIGLLHDTSSSQNISPTLLSPTEAIPKIPNLQYPRWIPSDNIKIIPQVTRYEPIPLSPRSFKFPSPSDPVQYIDENISKQFSQLQANVPNLLSPASYLLSPLLPSQSTSPILMSASPTLLPNINGLSALSNTMTTLSSSYISPLVSISSGNTQPKNVQMPLIPQNPITLEKGVPILNNKITQTAIPISASFISPLKNSVIFQPSSATSSQSQPKTLSITQPYQWTNLPNKSKFASNIASDIPLNSKLSLNNVLSPMPQTNLQASLPSHYDVVYSNMPTVDASISPSVTSKVTSMLASQSQLLINKLPCHTSFSYISNQNSTVQTSLPTISPSFNPIDTSQNLVSSIPTQTFASSNQVPSFIPTSSPPISIATLQPTVSIPDTEYISTMPNNLRHTQINLSPISPLSIQPLITPCSSISTDSNILPFTPTSLQYNSTPLLATVSPVRPMLSAQSTSPLSLTSLPLSLVPPEFSSLDTISPIPIPSITIRNSIQTSLPKLSQSIPCRYLSNNNPQYISPILLSADTYSSPQTTPIRHADPSTSQYTQPISKPLLSISTSSQAKYNDHTLSSYPLQTTQFSLPSMASSLFSKPSSLYSSKLALKPSPLKLQPNSFLHQNPLLPLMSSQHLLPHSSVIPWSGTPISHLWPFRPKATIKSLYSTPTTEFTSPVALGKSLDSSILPQSSVSHLSDIPYSTTSMSVKPIVSPLQPPETSEFLWTPPTSSISSFLGSGIQDVSKYTSKPFVSPLQPLETNRISLTSLMSTLKDMKPQIALPYSSTPIVSPLQPSEISKVTLLPPNSPITTLFTASPYSSTPIISPLQPSEISKVTVLPPSSPINTLLTALPYSSTPIISPLQPSEISKVTVLPNSSPINTLLTASPYSPTPIISPLQPSEISKVTVLPPSSPINTLLTASPYSPTPIISPLQPSEISKVTVLPPNSPINTLFTASPYSLTPIISPLQPSEISKVTVLPQNSPINTLFTASPYSSTPIISPLQPSEISKVTILPPSSPINTLFTALPYSSTPIISPLQPSEISKVTVLPSNSAINTLFTALPYLSTPIISPLQPSEISQVTVLPNSSPINTLLTASPHSPTPIISPLQPSETSKVTVLSPNSPINSLLTSGSQITAAFSPKPIVSPLQPPERNQSPLKLATSNIPPLDLVSQSSLLVTSPSVLESANNLLASYTQKYVQSFSPPIAKPSLQYARNEQNAIPSELTSYSEISTTPSLISSMPCKHTSAIPIAKIQSPIYDTQNIEPTSHISTKTAATYQSASSSSYLYNNPIYSATMPSTIYTDTQSQSSKPFTSLHPSPISLVSTQMPLPQLSPVSNYIIPYLDKTLKFPVNAINYTPTTSAVSKLTDKQSVSTQTAYYTPYSTSYSNLHPSTLNYSKASPRINLEVMSTIPSSSAIAPIASSSLVYTPKMSNDVLNNPPISSATIPNLPIVPINVQYSTHIGAMPLELVNTPIKYLKPSVISENKTPNYTPLSYNKYRPYQSPLWTSIYSNLPSNLVKPQSKPFYTSQNPSLSDTILPSSSFNKYITSISSPALNTGNVFAHSLIPLHNHNYYNKISPLLPVTTNPLSTLNTLLSPPINGHMIETSPTLTPLTIAKSEKSPQFTTFTSNVKSKAPLNYIESLATPMHYTISSSSETSSNSAQYITPLYTSIAPKELHTLAPLTSTEINTPNPFKYLPTTESSITSTLSTAPKDVTSSLFTSFYTPAVRKFSPASTEYYSPYSSYQHFNMPQSKFKPLPSNTESWTTLPSPTFTSLSNKPIASPPSTNIKPIYTTQYKYIPPIKSNSPEFTTHYSPNIYKKLPTYSSLLGSKLSPITSPLQYPNLIIPNLPLPNAKLISPDSHSTLSAFYPSISDYHLQEASTETVQLNPYSILPTSLSQSQLQPILTPLQSSQNIPLSLYSSQSSVLYSNLPPIHPNYTPITSGVINTDTSNISLMPAIPSDTPLTSSTSITRTPVYNIQYPAYTTTTQQYSPKATSFPTQFAPYSSEAIPLSSPLPSTESKPSITTTSSSYSSTSNVALPLQELPLVSQATTPKFTDIQPTFSKFISSVSSQLTSPATFHPIQVTPSSFISYTDYTPVTTVSPYSFPTSSPIAAKPSITSNYIPTVAKSIQPLFKPFISQLNAKTPTIPSSLLSPLNYNQVSSSPLKSQNILNIGKISPTSSLSTTPNIYYEYTKPCSHSNLSIPVPISNKFTDVTMPVSDIITTSTIPKLTNPISQYLPDSNLKTDLYNYITNNKDLASKLYNNKDISIPLGNLIITKKNCNNHTIESINSSIGLKVWPSNIKLVKARLQLKCVDLSSTNFEPIVNNISSYDLKEIQNIVANYIRNKYGDVIVVNEKYSLNNEYEVIRNNNINFNNKYNLLWPANTCSLS